MPYKECPNCGAHLDHGEHCDCEKEEKKKSAPPSKTNADPIVHDK